MAFVSIVVVVWVNKGWVKSKYKVAGRDGELVADIKKWTGRRS